MPDLLIELLSEEIPARMQARAAADLKERVTNGLVDAGLTYASAGAFATPRRLTLSVEGLLAGSPPQREERKGPRVDAPEKALAGFLRSAGVAREDLQIVDDKKGQVFIAVIERPGRPAAEIVAEVLERVVRDFPWPKSMRWGTGDLRWVRPLHSILCILSDEAGHTVVPLDIDGHVAGDRTRGHRFMAPAEFSVTGFDDYAAKLKRANVVLSAADRAEIIRADAETQAFALGLEVVEDPGLLAEVAGLVEWPVVLSGDIGAEFLHLPPEVLQTSMKEHQKFFSVRDPKSGRIVRFVTVANRDTADEGATILAGNRKVLSARLSDALFFWDNDLRVATNDIGVWVKALDNVTFHNKLGTVGERVNRVAALAREIAPLVGADPDRAEQAARLAKADLSSEMVYEFPELQGVMGRYYIEASGLDADIAAVAQEHYSPLGPSDSVPTAPLSVAVALADKIDVLAGFWLIDEKPTGSKDPFALRRAALGVIRLVLDQKLSVRLLKLIVAHITRVFSESYFRSQASLLQKIDPDLPDDIREEAQLAIEGRTKVIDSDTPEDVEYFFPVSALAADLLAFIHDRLKVYLRDRDIRHDIIDACLAMPGNDDLTLLVNRAEALSAVLKTEDGENLLQGFKRANNILSQAEAKDGVEYSYGADVKYAETDAERTLFAALDQAETLITPAMEAQDFETAMAAMATLRAPIDGFFEAVQVNADSGVIRRNRLNLLSRIRTLCLSVADLTRIEG
ncbi:glycine--tRNA ligase subunit beta [Oceaniovalibus sp. ACAM 378]|uniref:glycine--tRNA ligase subunit beta n=1 Tax=Oceaniovalibus sp. ACAM 378 TaxID=2599923 RepID=UPI0011D8A936|nr:glycine--tRNA ligase subunit beta [Oceaniovalibus sp. ACAM 378]TYB91191.1 glycine--tRNA ligase subunit beta [Oceaniovalibus sp. ACAM 378]